MAMLQMPLETQTLGLLFYPLDLLLDYLQTRILMLTGIAGNVGVLFTANDTYRRDVQIYVPADGVASPDAEENRHALEQMQKVLKADTRPSGELDLASLMHPSRRHTAPQVPRAVTRHTARR